MKQLFNDGWLFAETKADKALEDDWSGAYGAVTLPHDWLIYDAENLYRDSFGRYKKIYRPEKKSGSTRLYFEGVYMDCTVYVNHKPVCDNKYGYSSFEADITDFLTDGENEIEVLVRHYSPNTRWYSGAGIFRDVWLITTGESYIKTDGVYFHTEKSGNDYNCHIEAEVNRPDGTQTLVELRHGDTLIASRSLVSNELTATDITINDVPDEYIWDISSPNLLTLEVSLIKGGAVIDKCAQSVGLRDIEYKPDSGFYLNGRHIKLNGVCLHHDLGCLGAAFNKSAAERQLRKMREMGANAVRTSHNMPAKGFMELCDKLGILVDSEAFDMWERPKTEFDYARFFDDWYKKDVASWIRRDRNHPSVIMWSVGNEIYDTHVSPRGCEVAKLLHDEVRRHDPLKNAPTTIGSNYMPWEGAQNCAKQVDLAGYNYGEHLYEKHHEMYPDWCIYGSETTAGVKSRGIYHFPLDTAFLTHADLQCSSLGNCRAGMSAVTPQQVIAWNRDIDVCAGMFIWTGSDYIGEPSPYSTKNSYYGPIDTAGLEKDAFYLYRSAWTDKPTLHLFPYWDFNEGQLVDVVAYTNLREVELFVNGRSQGVKTPQEYTVTWQVPYEKGEIRVAGVSDSGEKLEDIRRSFSDSAKIVLTPEKKLINGDNKDIAVIVVSVVDKDGNPVENARDRVTLKIDGGTLLGFDNGDSTDYDSYKSRSRRLFSGKAAAYTVSGGESDVMTVTASAEGLVSSTVTINVQRTEKDVPVRKIELKRNGGAVITPDDPERTITARILPQNATYGDLLWEVVTNTGVAANCAVITPAADLLSGVVKINGDGDFRVRVSCRNGQLQPQVISDYEFTAKGFGRASIDPYEFVYGSLYSDSISTLDEVQRGGVNIKRDNNIVGFKKVDFSKYGTEGFSVRIINWHSDAPFNFRLWLGRPDSDGAVCVGDFTYEAKFEWQTYKDNSYTLPQRICGERDVYFEFDKTDMRIDFGGFCFVPKLKAYEKINAAENDLIHGDTYEICGGAINKIGNNVFIDYDDMDFRRGAASITIVGKTRHDNDSVHVHFVTDKTEHREIIEFPQSDDVISVTRKLSGISGKGTVKFIFLPGCDFDFESFEIKPEE